MLQKVTIVNGNPGKNHDASQQLYLWVNENLLERALM